MKPRWCFSCGRDPYTVEMRVPTFERKDGFRFVLVVDPLPLCDACVIAWTERYGRYVDERATVPDTTGMHWSPS